MKTAVTFLYNASKAEVKERQEKREWRKTYGPNYTPRRSMLVNSYRKNRQSVMSMFGGRPGSVAYDGRKLQRIESGERLDRTGEREEALRRLDAGNVTGTATAGLSRPDQAHVHER